MNTMDPPIIRSANPFPKSLSISLVHIKGYSLVSVLDVYKKLTAGVLKFKGISIQALFILGFIAAALRFYMCPHFTIFTL